MTEFLDIDGGQSACQLTGLTAAAEEIVAAPPELVWDLIADVTRISGWSPECVRAAWLGAPGGPQPGARFTGRNRFPNGFEYEVTCVVTEADRPRAFAWVVIAARRDGLLANMSATLRAMKSAAEAGLPDRSPGPGLA